MTKMQKNRGSALLWVLVALIVAGAGVMLLRANREAARVARQQQERTAEEQRRQALEQADAELKARQRAEAERSAVDRSYAAAGDLLARWDDAVTLAGATSRISLGDRVGALQALVREAEALVLPACLESHKPALVKGLHGVVDGYIAFMGDANLGKLVAQAAIGDGANAVQAFRTELSSCRSLVER